MAYANFKKKKDDVKDKGAKKTITINGFMKRLVTNNLDRRGEDALNFMLLVGIGISSAVLFSLVACMPRPSCLILFLYRYD